LLNQKILYLLLITFLAGFAHAETVDKFYSSFGLRLGFEFGGPVTFTIKTGAGFYRYNTPNEETGAEGFPMNNFESFSVGYRWRIGKRYPSYLFADVQAGNFLGGVGAGMATFRNSYNSFEMAPRISVFGGLFLWGTYDYVFNDLINPDIGLQLILASP